ncbi:MAG: lipoyl protein ligase domain-containing protein [Parachlamydiaceae bacterium]
MTHFPSFHLLVLNQIPIFEQLQIEEALFRADDRNWCIVNCGSSPAIVMGISGKQSQHICPNRIQQDPIPIIRRFSGGGTVIVDEQTLFYTLIGNRSMLTVPCYPNELLHWTETLYRPAFKNIEFALRDNDYVIQDKKFGGNAQYLAKERWLHHSSLLWDYHHDMMDYLLMPPKMPNYRKLRAHSEFLCRLCDHFHSQDTFHQSMIAALQQQFTLIPTPFESIEQILKKDFRRSTRFESF